VNTRMAPMKNAPEKIMLKIRLVEVRIWSYMF
jgi:hypothetical protein